MPLGVHCMLVLLLRTIRTARISSWGKAEEISSSSSERR